MLGVAGLDHHVGPPPVSRRMRYLDGPLATLGVRMVEANCRLNWKRTFIRLPAVAGWSQELSATSFAVSDRNTANSRR